MEVRKLREYFSYYRKNKSCIRNHSKVTFEKVISLFMLKLVEKLKNTGYIELPEKLGNLSIVGTKIKVKFTPDGEIRGLAPNWKLTKEMWEKYPDLKEKKEVFYHTNDSTNNVRYKIHWGMKNVLIKNKNLYTFVAARHLKRAISKLIQQGKEYIIK